MAEKAVKALHGRPKTWYSLPVDIAVASNHWHRVVVLGLALPHLGLVNLFARWGLPVDERLALTWRHEFGHLQTIPVPLVHLLLMFWLRRRKSGSRWLRAAVGIVAHQAVWELAAEGYVVVYTRHGRKTSRSATGRIVRAILWGGMALIAAAGTAFLVRGRASSPATASRP